MKHTKHTKKKLQAGKKLLLCSFLFLLALTALHLLYITDNKYNKDSCDIQDGVLLIDTQAVCSGSPVYLTEGWEVYPDRLLSPEDFPSSVDEKSHITIRIGDYLNFAGFHEGHSPHGLATYRLRLASRQDTGGLVVYLPEVFSACRVFINGRETAVQGSLQPYSPLVRDLTLSVPDAPEMEIIIQTANYSHYYSGITYPPVLGTAQTIHLQSAVRMGFYGLLCFFSLSAALLSAAVWLGSRKQSGRKVYYWLGILALTFSLHCAYPFFHTAGLPFPRILYGLEDGSSMLIILCTAKIVFVLSKTRKKKAAAFIELTALAMLLVSVLLPLFLLSPFPYFIPWYGQLISWYKLSISFLLLIFSLWGSRGEYTVWLAAGTAVYSAGLLSSVLTLNRWEPACAGWPDEYGTFFLILCFSGLMLRMHFQMAAQNRQLTEHLQDMVEERTNEVTLLLSERQKILSEFLHDLKSPIACISAYLQLVKENDIHVDKKTQEKIDMIEKKYEELSVQIRSIQDFNAGLPHAARREQFDLRKLIQNYYSRNRQDVEVFGPRFLLSLPSSPCRMLGNPDSIIRAIENLSFNSMDFTPADGTITLSLSAEDDSYLLSVSDTGCGIPENLRPHIFDRSFTTRKEDGGNGLGLFLVKTIAQEHRGSVRAESLPGKGCRITLLLPAIL